jgi:alcohol dehydrogenase (NADP+)
MFLFTPFFGNTNCAFSLQLQGVHVMASSWPATAYMLHRKEVPALLRAPLVASIARRLGKRPAQVLIRWALQHGTSVSPKAGSHDHVQVIIPVFV